MTHTVILVVWLLLAGSYGVLLLLRSAQLQANGTPSSTRMAAIPSRGYEEQRRWPQEPVLLPYSGGGNSQWRTELLGLSECIGSLSPTETRVWAA
jgi:hypothetical protein